MSLKTLLVEDEPLSKLFLSRLLREVQPPLELIAAAATVNDAVEAIQNLKPDLIFLDIELREGSGFDILKQLPAGGPQVVFTTALDHQATNMLRLCGVPYLQKPIDQQSLNRVLQQVRAQAGTPIPGMAIEQLLHALAHEGLPERLLISTATGSRQLPVHDIIRLEKTDEGTILHGSSGAELHSDLPIKDFESLLQGYAFFRAHPRHLINTQWVQRIAGPDFSEILMQDGSRVPLSEKKQTPLLQILELNRQRPDPESGP